RARDRRYHVRDLGNQVIADARTVIRGLEVAREQVTAKHGDVGVILVVVVGNVRGESVLEDSNGGNLETAEHADDTGLRHRGSRVARQESGLVGREDQALDVVFGLIIREVDDGEQRVGVIRSKDRRVFTKQEPNRDDDVVVLLDELREICRIVGLLLRLQNRHLNTEFFFSPQQAIPGRLVEGTVVHATSVGDHTSLEVTSIRRFSLFGFLSHFLGFFGYGLFGLFNRFL